MTLKKHLRKKENLIRIMLGGSLILKFRAGIILVMNLTRVIRKPSLSPFKLLDLAHATTQRVVGSKLSQNFNKLNGGNTLWLY